MLELFLAFFLAMACPSHSNTSGTHGNGNQVTTLDGTGGETGDIPPTPPHH